MTKAQEIITSILLLFGLVAAPIAVTATAGAQTIQDGLNKGTCLNVESATANSCPTGDVAEDRVNNIITTVINIFSIIVGIVAVIMIIIGGLKYITSGGDSGNISGAKNTILYAVIGLIVVALAQVIVRFVLQKATSTAS